MRNKLFRDVYFVITLALFVVSCSGGELDPLCQEDNVSNHYSTTRMAADGKWDALGFGYDITGDYLHVNSIRNKVIDMEAFEKEFGDRCYNPATVIGTTETYAGANVTEFLKEITDSKSSSSSANMIFFSGTITDKSEFHSKSEYSSNYSFARGDVMKRVKRLYLDIPDVSILLPFITPAFYQNLQLYTPDRFVETYGTHVLIDITIGGRLSFLYRSIIAGNNENERKKKIVESGLKFSIWKIGANTSSSFSTETIKQLKSKNTQWECFVEYHGGTSSGRSDTFNAEGGFSTTINQSVWEQSVNDNNAALVEVDWEKAIPIWEFVEDSTKKEEIRQAAIRYIENRKVEMTKGEEMVPFYRFYIPWCGDYLFTYEQDEMLRNGYQQQELVGAVYKRQMPGTIPLYCYKKTSPVDYQDHAYTTQRYDAHLINTGYTYLCVNGYIPESSAEDGVISMTEYSKLFRDSRFWHAYSSTGSFRDFYYNRPGFYIFTY